MTTKTATVAMMMTLKLLTITCLFEVPEAAALTPLERMANIFPGHYDNDAQYLHDLKVNTSVDDFHPHVDSRLVNVTVPALHVPGDYLFYIQQREFSTYPNQGGEVYRQAIYQLTTDPANSSTIVLSIWMMLKDPERWLNPWDAPAGVNPFANLTKSDVSMTPACRVYWEEVDSTVPLFHSYMGQECLYNVSAGQQVRITDENWLSPDYLTIHEKWFDLNGTEVVGLKTCLNETKVPEQVKPVWPVQWHADILITGTQETSELEVEIIDSGGFYYDWDEKNNSGKTAMFMANISNGDVTRNVNMYGVFYYINDTTNACYHFNIPGVDGPAKPKWLEVFTYNETQYLTKREGFDAEAQWETASHWQYDAFGGGPNHLFNYWSKNDGHQTPSRIMGPSLTTAPYGHSFIELDHYHIGFDDVPDVGNFFTIPANCGSALDPVMLAQAAQTNSLSELKRSILQSEATAETSNSEPADSAQGPSHDTDWRHLQALIDRVALSGSLSPLVLLSDRVETTSLDSQERQQLSMLESSLKSVIAAGKSEREKRLNKKYGDALVATDLAKVPSDTPYPVWPSQFYCNHTGNGLTFDSWAAPLAEKGVFYYDSKQNRSATVYYDVTNPPQRLRQIFMDGWVYRINETTGSCTAGHIPDSFGMSGPVFPDFIKSFEKQKDRYMLRNHTAAKIVPGAGTHGSGLGLGSVVYSRTSHWTMWAFAAQPSSAFHAWMQLSTGLPFQVFGPGPALPPYGLSFLGYEDVTPGLDGIDIDTVFEVPSECRHNVTV